MSSEGMKARLARLEEEMGARRRVGAVYAPQGLDLDSVKGRAWLATHLPTEGVVVLPEPAKDVDEWERRYSPRRHTVGA